MGLPKLLEILDVDHDEKLTVLEAASFIKKVVWTVLAFKCDLAELAVNQLLPPVLTGGINFALAQKNQIVEKHGGIEGAARHFRQMGPFESEPEDAFLEMAKGLTFPLKKSVVDALMQIAFRFMSTDMNLFKQSSSKGSPPKVQCD